MKRVISIIFAIWFVIKIDSQNQLAEKREYKDNHIGEIIHLEKVECSIHNNKELYDEEIKYIFSKEEILEQKLEENKYYEFYYLVNYSEDNELEFKNQKEILKNYLEKNNYSFCCEEPGSISFVSEKCKNLSIKCKLTLVDEEDAKIMKVYF